MEFYLKPCIALRLLEWGFNSQRDGILQKQCYNGAYENIGFNSQRDGILPAAKVISWLSEKSFNSQRDGILQQEQHIKYIQEKFQFPTGWNSTGQRKSETSIRRGFNSQRDGILRWAIFGSTASLSRFNSQRDGILPRRGACERRSEIVSIPNGMEFYERSRGRSLLWSKPVSIPNGMEFYRGARFSLLPCQLFQFPTGWNSTVWSGVKYALSKGFNSQRDGILQHEFCHFSR